MKTRTKVIGLIMAAVLLVGASILGTLAYLTDKEEVNNTFTVGKVDIKLDEAQVDEYGNPVDDAGNIVTDPADVVRIETGNEYKLIPGHTYAKDPTVTVLEKSEPSYVRILVTINKKAEIDALFGTGTGVDITSLFAGYDAAKWSAAGAVSDTDTRTYEFRYTQIVDARTAAQELEPIFTHIVVPGELSGTQIATLEGLKMDVVAQAIQADGFADEDAAWTAFPAV